MVKKRIIWIFSIIIFIVAAVLIGAGNYFYTVAIDRGHGDVELYSGDEEDVEPVSSMIEEQKQAKLEEILKWTEEQSFQTLEVTSQDGLKLKASFLENKDANGKAVILAHGYRGSSEQMPGITKFYHDQGYHVLKPDARGHGKSEGDYVGYGWHDREDYKLWVQLLVDDLGVSDMFLHGFSMGAATVLMTSGEELQPEVKGIIADSGYTSVLEELTHQLKYLYRLPAFPLMEVTSVVTSVRAGYTFSEASAINQVKENKLPLFIIHGDKDVLVPTEMAYRLFEAAGGDKELWIVPGVGHTEAYTEAEEEYQKRLLTFLEKAMGQAAVVN